MTTTTLLPFQPDQMTPAQQAAVSYLARYAGHTHKLYAGHTHKLYAYQLRRWFAWCENRGFGSVAGDPTGAPRALHPRT